MPIAEALDAAHRKGIVHRDLKPANILVTKTGVKLLDFGLAKMNAPAISDAIHTQTLTGIGTILGTMQYMPPEQLQGREADARSDIFAFGLVLYEMLTGKRAFEGSSQASLIGAILQTEPPPVSTVVPDTPPPLGRLIRKCLAKDPDNRWQSARDIAGELQWIAEGGWQSGKPAPVAARRRGVERMGWITASLLALIAMALSTVAVRHLRESPPPREAVRFRLDLPEGVALVPGAGPSISPDGRKIVVAASSGPKSQLWLRGLDSPAPCPLPGTEGAIGGPIFSPDGRSLAFMSGPNLRRLDLASGAIQSLCVLQGQNVGPDAWNHEGLILLHENLVIKKVSASGGAPKPVTELATGESSHSNANFLPDGHRFLYFVSTTGGSGTTYAASIDDPRSRKQILQAAGPVRYASPDWLVFSRDNVLFAQSFDADKAELRGEPAPIAELTGGNAQMARVFLAASETGSLAWRAISLSFQLTWLDRTGKERGTVGEPGDINNPALSPDGKRVLINIRDPATKTRDVWILDLVSGANSRITFDPAEDYNPAWSPDGAYVFFSSNRKGHRDIYRKRADGVGAEEELLVSDGDKNVDAVSPDGKFLLYNVNTPGKQWATWSLPLTGARKPTLVAGGEYFANHAQFSPDGRWIAYTAQESGRTQVVVQSAPGSGLPAGKWQVSVAGGMRPQWRRDGKELFFEDGDKFMAAPVKSDGTSFESAPPVQLFTTQPGPVGRNDFIVSADSQRFLFVSPRYTGSGEVHILLNWPALYKKN
ncbi:MAG TPA: protein kinase [Bryobacteraceae bacterium]|nr:protein kinase [Bryobacteraceae bacterium]